MKAFSIIFIFIVLNSCSSAQEKEIFPIKGISFEAPSVAVNDSTFQPIKSLGASWISIMPYGFTKNGEANIKFNIDWQWRGERTEGVEEAIKSAKANDLKVMMKPHLWIHNTFTGDVKFDTEEDWNTWEASYAKYILYYAELSEKHQVEMLCIGTELKQFIIARPQFWDKLINDVREVYKGKITYAANWDNYDKIPFWKELDYIGVDAYFPVCESKTPTKETLTKGWEKWWKSLETTAEATSKNVIFTEIGYRSIDYCGKQPWVSYEDLGAENQQGQANCLEAFFETSRNKEFFEGAFLWKWHCEKHLPKEGNKKYTFQNKEAEKLVREFY